LVLNALEGAKTFPAAMRGTPAHATQDREPSQVCRLGGRQSLQELKTSQRAPAFGRAIHVAFVRHAQRGSPWENGYIESFNARLRDELLNGEIFYTLREAQIVIEKLATPLQSCIATPICLCC
jgi:putative transposase